MKFKIYLFSFIYSCFIIGQSNKAYSQNIVAKHFTVNDGLPSSECYWVMQDSRHFLWIATDAGVVKYDGYKFITYNSSKGLPDNTVFKIHEDNHGRIWFSNYSGKFSYYVYDKDSIYTIPSNKALSALVKFAPVDFCFDAKDTLWASLQLEGYIKMFPPDYKKFIHYRLPSQGYFIKDVGSNKIIYGNDAKDIQTAGRFLPFYLIKSGKTYFYTNPSTANIPGVSLSSAVKSGPNNYLFSNDNSVFSIHNRQIKELFNFSLKTDKSIINLFRDSKNKIWVSTHGSGASAFNKTNLTTKSKNFFPNDIVSCTTEDVDKGYWFTTTNTGVYYIPSLDFNYYNKENGLNSDKVNYISILNNKLYCVTGNYSLNTIDLDTKKITSKPNAFYSYIYSFDQTLLFNEKTIKDLYLTGTRIVTQSNKKGFYIKRSGTEEKLVVNKVFEYDADFLVGFNQSSFIYKINKHTGEAFKLTQMHARIFAVYKQRDNLFIGTKQGLYKLKNGKIIYLGDNTPLLAGRIEAITEADNSLLIATRGFGVICYKNNKITHQFNEATGLASNICKCITKGSDGTIWVGTNKGISILRPDHKGNYINTTLNIYNGLISNEINQLVEYNNSIYFATNNGVGTFNIPDAFNRDKKIPIYIENMLVNNKPADFKKNLRLNYNDNFIKINYKGIYLKRSGDITYKYKLNGLDTNWMFTKNTFVQFTTLPAGNYKFIVCAIASDGAPDPACATLSFCINRPFWETWWFYLILITFISGIIYLIYNRRINMIKKIENEKTLANIKIAGSELKALRAQMNPHFIFNAINSIQNFVMKNESDIAQKYLTKFSRLIRAVLENSKQEMIALNKEIETLKLYIELEALRASFSFDFEIIIDEAIKQKNINIPTMLIQPYIENSILHGLLPLTERRGKIVISFEEADSKLICKIDDTGIGRMKADEIKQKKELRHQSMGMSVTKERVDTLNKYSAIHTVINIIDKYNNEKPSGTTVIIEIKI